MTVLLYASLKRPMAQIGMFVLPPLVLGVLSAHPLLGLMALLMRAKSATRPRSPGTVQTTSRAKRMSRVHDISDGTVVVRKRRRGSFCLSIVQVRRMLSSNPGFEDDAPPARDRRAGCEWMRSRTGFAPHRSGDGRWR